MIILKTTSRLIPINPAGHLNCPSPKTNLPSGQTAARAYFSAPISKSAAAPTVLTKQPTRGTKPVATPSAATKMPTEIEGALDPTCFSAIAHGQVACGLSRSSVGKEAGVHPARPRSKPCFDV